MHDPRNGGATPLINVKGRQVHVVRRWREGQAGASPTYIIEAACGWHSAMYVWMIEALSKHAAVITYDRCGLGWSPPTHATPDGETRARELHDLLEVMNLTGPLIFIGHSIAGLYLRIYAHHNPSDVLGLVFLDATHECVHQLLKTRVPISERMRTFLAIWASRAGIKKLPFALTRVADPPWNSLPAEARREIEQVSAITNLAVTAKAESDLLASVSRQAKACGNLRDTPLLVISGGVRTNTELRYTADPHVFMDTWMLLQRDLTSLSTRAVHRIIEGAGHCDLVTDKRHADRVCAHIVEFSQGLQLGAGA